MSREPKELGRNLSWIIARTGKGDIGAREPGQEIFEIAVCRHQDEVTYEAYSRDSEIACTRKDLSERILRLRE